MRQLYCLLIASALSACAFETRVNRGRAVNAVGLWEESDQIAHAIVLRRPDGTYRRKEIHIFPKPSTQYESSGRWSVDRGKYNVILDDISAPKWKRYIGKQWTQAMVSQTPAIFTYISTDNAKIEERRIGEAIERAFDNTPLKP